MTPISPSRRSRPSAADRSRGFTLLELMVVIAIVAMTMSGMVYASRSLLPQSRLASSADEVGGSLDDMRLHALLRQEALLFVYDLEENTYEAFSPHERDQDGDIIGPGLTSVLDPRELQTGMEFRAVRFNNGDPRVEGRVLVDIAADGRVPPHDVIIENPEHPETEVLTLRVHGLGIRHEVLAGDVYLEIVDDASFR